MAHLLFINSRSCFIRSEIPDIGYGTLCNIFLFKNVPRNAASQLQCCDLAGRAVFFIGPQLKIDFQGSKSNKAVFSPKANVDDNGKTIFDTSFELNFTLYCLYFIRVRFLNRPENVKLKC